MCGNMLSFFSLQSTDVHGAEALHLDLGLCRTDPHTKVQLCEDGVVGLYPNLKHVLSMRPIPWIFI